MNILKRIAIGAILVTALVGIGKAIAGDSVGYVTLKSAPTVVSFATTASLGGAGGTKQVAAVDSQVWTSALRAKATRGNPKVAILAESDTASATVVVRCGLYVHDNAANTDTFIGEAAASQTVTCSATATEGATASPGLNVTVYPGPIITFDTGGATHYDIRVTSISSGAVNSAQLKHWVYGLQSQ